MTRLCTIVIPAYNAARFLEATLDSVVTQTLRDSDAVVVDDGSQDETGAVAGHYPAVRLIRQRNAGVAAARNRGVRGSHSEWVAFLDADDLWMPEKLRCQFERAQETGAGAIFCDLRFIDIEGQEIPQPPATEVSLEMEPLLMHSERIPQGTSSTLLVRRSVFESVGGYDESLATMADWDLLIRLRRVTEFAHVPRRLVAYRRYAGSMSRSVTMLERESRIVLDKAFGERGTPKAWRGLERKSRAWNDLVLSGSYAGAGSTGRAIGFALRAIARDPRLLGRLLLTPLRRRRRIGVTSL